MHSTMSACIHLCASTCLFSGLSGRSVGYVHLLKDCLRRINGEETSHPTKKWKGGKKDGRSTKGGKRLKRDEISNNKLNFFFLFENLKLIIGLNGTGSGERRGFQNFNLIKNLYLLPFL